MAAKVIWSPQAIEDINEICRYIAKDSPSYAYIFAQSIISAAEDILLFPHFGRVVPEKRDEKLREKILGNYRIIYRIKSESIQIATVIHGARILRI